jgi:hypothetical protein
LALKRPENTFLASYNELNKSYQCFFALFCFFYALVFFCFLSAFFSIFGKNTVKMTNLSEIFEKNAVF